MSFFGKGLRDTASLFRGFEMASLQLLRSVDTAGLREVSDTGFAFTVDGKYEELDTRLKMFNKTKPSVLFARIDMERKEIFREHLLVPKTDMFNRRFTPVYEAYVKRLDVILSMLRSYKNPSPRVVKDLLVFSKHSEPDIIDAAEAADEWNTTGFAFTKKGLRRSLDTDLRQMNFSQKNLLWNNLTIEREKIWNDHVQIESKSIFNSRFTPIYVEYLAKLDELIDYFRENDPALMTDEEVKELLVFEPHE